MMDFSVFYLLRVTRTFVVLPVLSSRAEKETPG